MEKFSKILIVIGGILYLIFGLFHLTFFRVLNSDNPDFKNIAPFLSKIMIMLNLGIVVLFMSLGVIILRYREEILETKSGRAILVSSSLFFIVRGLAEFIFSSYKTTFVLTMFLVSFVFIIPLFIKNDIREKLGAQ